MLASSVYSQRKRKVYGKPQKLHIMSILNKLLFTLKFRVAYMQIVQVILCNSNLSSLAHVCFCFFDSWQTVKGASTPPSGLEWGTSQSSVFRPWWCKHLKIAPQRTSHYFSWINQISCWVLFLWYGTLSMFLCFWYFSKWKRTCSIICFRKSYWFPQKVVLSKGAIRLSLLKQSILFFIWYLNLFLSFFLWSRMTLFQNHRSNRPAGGTLLT